MKRFCFKDALGPPSRPGICLQMSLGSPELELPTLSPFTIAQGAGVWA